MIFFKAVLKKTLFFMVLCFLLLGNESFAQVCGTSGFDGPQNAVPPVNTYFPLASNTTLASGSKSITLQAVPPNDPNFGLSYGVTPIKSGDLILIIQMQDASFNSANSNLYGRGLSTSGPDGLGGTGYTGLGNTGKFEYIVATSDVALTGGVLNFRGGGAGNGCVNTYTNADFTATVGQKRFQIIRVPQYSNLVLNSNITTPPYNGSVGGVIAFDVAGTMQFNGFIIDASERGFRGGYGPVASSGVNDNSTYRANSTSTKSVGKGEGIAGTPRYMWDGFKQVDNFVEGLPGGSYGRGAPGNAGGAGNDHNAGGGGGGNGGFGGLGGKGWQGGGGDKSPLTGGGRPGFNLPIDVSRLVMGGGGGGGDANNATSGVKGGVGGGVVLINVEKITGNGTIKANGGNGEAGAFGSAPDGAGGGGAGGSVFLRSLAASPAANLTIEAKGGAGGNTKNDNNDEHGPGGGGGGGLIYTQIPSATINTNIQKGIAGKTNNGAGNNHGAIDGTNGGVKIFVTSDLPAHLQGGGSICYPALDVTLREEDAGPAGMRASGTTANYKLKVYNNLGGGNAGDVKIDFELPYGFSLSNVTQTLTGDAASSTPLSFTVGSTGKINFGSYNISPGDYVELTISVNIANNVPSGVYHASAQATYLDPTRTNANPIRKITAYNNSFTGNNTTYETGGINNVPGTNYNGNLIASTTEDVYINAPVVVGECSAIVNGGFESSPVGEYDSPNYIGGWQVVNPGEKVKIVTQNSLKGALIRDNGAEHYSLQQKINSVKSASDYTLTFNYRNWTDGTCNGNSTSKLQVQILDATSNAVIVTSPEYNSSSSPNVATINFTTLANTDAIILKVYDPDSPKPACGAFVDDFDMTSPLAIQLSEEDVKCYGDNNGRLSVIALSGAAGPYKISYSSDGGLNYSAPVNTGIITAVNPFVINNLSAGNYTLKISDENNCINTRQFDISEPNELTLSGNNSAILCYGGKSTVTLNASGGTSPYQYSMDGINYQSQNTFPDLLKGTYTFTVKDANDCLKTFGTTINQPSVINVSASATAVLCFGGTSDVTLTASGGTGTYQYSLDGIVFQNSNVFNGVLAGPQIFTVKDANNCIQTKSVTIAQPTKLTIAATQTEIKCFGETSIVELTANGGTGAYQYSRDKGATFQNTNTFTNLTAGTYNFQIKDANACTKDTTITIAQPTKLTIAASQTEIKCFGESSTISITANGGTGAYQYSKDKGATFQNTNTFTNLTAGTYNFQIKDANACTKDTTITIAQPTKLTIAASQTEIKCFGESSTISITANGGTGAYQYSKDNGATFQTTNTFTNLTAGTYNFQIKDANTCTKDTTITVAQPTKLTLTATQTAIKCFGETSTVELTANGGTGAYQYSKDNGATFQNNNTFTNLTAGTYNFQIKDANACTKDTTITIVQPTKLTIAATQTEIKCFGEQSTVELTAGGGTGAYEYSKDNGATFQTTNTFANLIAGTYNFLIKDANACTKDTTITIAQPTKLTLTASQTEIKCFGESSTISITANGGTGAYQYSKDNGATFQNTNTFANLIAGTYNFLIKDANACTKDTTITIAQPTKLTIAASQTEIKCFGESSTISITANGGTGAYQYSKDNGTTFQNTNTFTNLTAGTYNFQIKDANACTKDTTITIVQPTKLTITATQTAIKCFGESSTISITANGGTGAYQYSKDNGATFQNTNTFANLIAGTYNFQIKDANACTKDTTITIAQPTKLTLTASQTEIKCFGETSTVELTANGGTGAYQYSKDNGATFQNTNIFTNLTAGTYNFQIKDANACTKDTTITIAQPTKLTISATQTAIKCFGETSTVELTANGGTGAYEYSKDNGTTFQTTNTFTNLTAGTYNFQIKDANACTKDTTITIAQPTKLTIAASQTAIKCFGESSTISITANGGTGAYEYSKDNGATFQTTNTFTNLIAGTYNFQIRDANACTKDTTITIAEPTKLSLTATQTAIKCFGEQSTVELTAGGGTGAYEYSKDNGTTFQTTNTFTNLTAGTYNFQIKDANACTKDTTITIAQPTKLTIAASQTEIKCFEESSTISITANGGTGAYQYSKDNGATFQNTNTFTNLTAGTYNFQIKDANACTKDTTITIAQPTKLTIAASQTEIKCFGESSTISITANGGTGAYQYSKDNGATFQANNTFTNLTAGTYTFQIKDANACTKDTTITIVQPTKLTISATQTAIKCFGETSTVELTAGGGTGAYQYKDNGTTFQTTNTFTNLTAGTYNFQIKDANACTKDTTITIAQPTKLTIAASQTEIKCFGETSTVELTANGGTGAYQYSKDNGTTFQTTNTFTNLIAGTYNFQIKDANACTKDTTITIAQPTKLTIAASQTEIKCFGESSTISINANGGTGVYQYSKDNGATFQTTNTFTNLIAGTYNFQVKDANACTKDTTITIAQPTKLTLTATQTAIKCFGETSTVELTTSGGTGAYQYSKDNGTTFQTINIFTNLYAGTYNFQIRDANACTKDTTITIVQPTKLTLTATQTEIKCFGETSAVELTAGGGTGIYQYSKDNGTTFQNTNTFANLYAGTYNFQIKDANACTKDTTITIAQPTKLSLTATQTAIKCFGETSSVELTANGGTGAYQYSKDNGATFQTTNTFTNLIAGTYNFQIKDANACTKDTTITIAQPTKLTLTATQTAIKCFGESSTISITANGGTGAYQYSKDNGATFQATNTFTNLIAGTYNFQIKDANACTKDTTITIAQPTKLSLTATQTAIKCFGETSSVELTANGGTGAYQYSKDNGATFQATNTFTNLIAGTYNFQIKDANACTKDTTITIAQPTKLTIAATQTEIKCFGETSTVELTANGGTGVYQYSKDNGATFQTTNTFTNLTAGTYNFQIKDANACTKDTTITTAQPTKLTIAATQTEIKCFGETSTVELTANGGTGVYQYSKDNGATFQTTNTFTNLTAGTYNFQIKDANACTKDTTITIAQPTKLTIAASQTAIKCFGETSTIELTANGGTGVYEYSKDNGTTFQATNTFANLIAGTYNFQIKDANACTKDTTITIAQPTKLTIAASQTAIKCFGETSTVELTANGGTGTYQYSKDNGATFQNNNTFTNLTAGTYTFQIRDANACTKDTTITIAQPTKLTIAATQTEIKCLGESSTISITANGGTGAYQYSKDNGATFQTTNTFTNLIAGTYNFQIKDANACTKDTTITIAQPTKLTIAATQTAIKCFGETSTVELTANGGTGAYQYSKDNGATFQNNNTFTNLTAGTYNFQIKDANACTKDTTITIAQPTKLTLTATQTAIKCFGETSTVELTANGGTGAYQYSKDNGTTFQNTNTFTNLTAGTYNFQIKDANACTKDTTITIDQPTKLTIAASQTEIKCFGESSTISITANGGTGSYQYSKDNGSTFQTTNTFTNLTAGTYNFQIKDANACTKDTTIIIAQPTKLTIAATQTEIKCFGESSTISITANGGTGAYQYSKDNGATFQTTNTFTNLYAGTYNFQIKDANACTKDTTITIAQPTKLTLTATQTEIKCFGETSAVELTVGGGTGIYQYSKDNGTTFQNNNTFANLNAGTYNFQIRDANACTKDTTITIAQPTKLTIAATQTAIKCFGETSTVELTAGGGTGVYQYSKDNGATFQNNNTFTNLTTGTYNFQIKDANACTKDTTITIAQPTKLTITATQTEIKCFGETSTIELTANGGTGAYQYSKDNGATFQNNNTFTNLIAGTYNFQIKDANACTKDTTITIVQPTKLIISATQTAIKCFGETSTVELTANGGTGVYQYSKDNGTTFQNNNTFTNLTAGTYTFQIKDANACTKDTTITIAQPTKLTIAASQTEIKCFGETSTVELTANGGTGAYQYSKDNGATFQNNNTFTNLIAGTYNFQIKDANACTKDTTITIVQPTKLIISATQTAIKCFGESSTISITANGGTGVYQYSKDNGTTFQNNNTFTNLTAGTYTFQIKDANACTKDTTITIAQPTKLTIAASQTAIKCFGETSIVELTANGGTGVYQYSKDNGTTFQTTNTFTNLTAGTYNFQIKDANACTKDTTITIVQPTKLIISATQTAIKCFGESSTISITANGGTGSYQYSKDNGSTFQTTNTFTNLIAGTYNFQIKDVNACTKDTTITIAQPTKLTIAATQTAIKCFGEQSTVELTANGGTGAYQYSKDNGATFQTTNTFTNLTAGTYNFQIKDANACTKDTTITIVQPTKLTISASQTAIKCFGEQSTVELTAGGGTGAYQYSKDNGTTFQANNTFTNLIAGTYNFQIKDANACTKDTTITIAQPIQLTLTATQTVIKCFGESSTISITANGGTGAYQYSKDNGATFQNNNTFTNLIAGTYNFQIKDANACTKDTTITIVQPTKLIISATQTAIKCFGETSTVELTANGGTGVYQYSKDNGTTFQNNNTFTNLTAGTYTFQIKDANACTKDTTITIAQPTKLTIAASQTEIKCFGETSTVELTANGGTGAYQYSKDNGATFQNNNTFTNLIAGTYNFQIKDANACTKDTTITIVQPTKLIISATQTAIKCFGESSTISITANGGTGVYQYSKDNGTTFQNNNTFTNLTAGTYTFQIKDANACTKDTTITIAQPTKLTIAASQTAIKCFGETSTVELTAGGGTGAYQYSKDNGTTFQTTNTFTNLTAGTYNFQIKDANACTKDTTITIAQPTKLTISATQTTIKCFGETSTVELTANGGTGTYQYSKDNGTTFQTTNTFTNLTAGTYNFQIKDANACTKDTTITIAQPTKLTIVATQTEIKCFGETSTVELTAGGGTGAYQYSKDNGTTFQTTNTFTNLIAGTYNFQIKDANACTKDTTITIAQPTKLTIAASQTEIKCFGESSTISITANGGTGAYQYSKDNGATFQTTNTFTNLIAGTYNFQIKDANACTKDTTITIAQPTKLTISATQTAIKCYGETSTVELIANNGTGVYQYSKDNGTTFQTTNTFANLTAGTYNFQIKDANACTKDTTITIDQPTKLTIAASQTEIKCFGESSTISITANGGTGSYQYSKDNGSTFQTTNTFTNLIAGTYNFQIKDANACTKDTTITIDQPTKLTIAASQTEIKCFGEQSTVELIANGGTGAYQYSKDNGTTFQNTNTFTNLAAGTYNFQIKDANACTKDTTITIDQPTKLTIAASQTEIKCFGESSTISITANGGTGSYQYSKDNGTTFQGTNTFTNLTAGTYNFQIKDANACTKDTTITIVQPTKLIISATQTAIKCFGETSTVELTANGGTGAYQYSKDNGATFQANNTFTNLIAGTYNFQIKDANACTKDTTITIAQPTKLTISATQTAIKCYGETSTVELIANNGTGVYQYSKDNGTTFQTTNTFANLIAGIYNFQIKDANACTKDTTITIVQPTVLTLKANSSGIKCKGETATVTLTGSGGTGAYQYSEDGTNFQASNLFSDLAAGNYTFIIKDANNCLKTISITITEPSFPLSIVETHQNNICYSDNKGQIKINVSGGTAPYTYKWSNGALTKDISNLSPGLYDLLVTDKNGCKEAVQIEILPSKPFTILEEITQVKCFEEATGSISLKLSGGQAPYTVKWDNELTGNTRTNLTAGNYTYTATDALGCSINKSINITQPQKLAVQITVKNTTCKYSPDGAIFTKVTGGTSPYRFIWNNTDRGANSSLINISNGKYTVTVIDANNCSVQIIAEVLPGNCAPSADNDNYKTKEDTPIIINTPGIIINDIDPDDDDLKISLNSAKDPSGQTGDVSENKSIFKTKNGTVTLNDDGSFTYTPNKNFYGTEYFIYEVTDGKLNSNFAQVTIVVEAVNDPPIAQNDNYITLEDTPIGGSVAPNDIDPENDPLTYTLVNQPINGTLTFNTDGTFNYVPLEDFNGTITFSYQVCDPQGLCDQAIATIDITPVNDPPIALDDKFYVQKDIGISQKVSDNDSDPDGDLMQYTALTQPQNGTLVFNANGTFTYQPKPGFKGIDSFRYKTCDPSGLCDNATVTLIVQPKVTVNLVPPTAIIREGDTIHVTAVLTESLLEDVTVFLSINGTATLNQDYKLSKDFVSIIIPANQTQTTQYFIIHALLDDIRDNGETVITSISRTSQPNFVDIGSGSIINITDVYPESKPTAPGENPDINPDPMVSPNGDGSGNENFLIYNISKYPDNEVVIFNRWGNEVYRTKSYDNKGNSFRGVANVGILTNSNKDLVDGVYYYLIYTTQNGEKKMNKGYIILKR